MIATLRGKYLYSDATYLVVECSGIGFKCFVTKNTLSNLPNKGEEIFLYTHMVVREDAMDLYGFSEIEELNAFKLITSVNGVGAKIGIAILSEFNPEKLYFAIQNNDAKILTAASGVGIKLAQRIVLELKDKVGTVPTLEGSNTVPTQSGGSASEAVEALVALGFTKGQASLTVARLDSSLSTEEMIKQALANLSRGI